MNNDVFNRLSTTLSTIKTDVGILAMTIAGIAAIVAITLLIIDYRTAPTTRSSRWEFLFAVLLGAFLLGGIGGILASVFSLGQFFFGTG